MGLIPEEIIAQVIDRCDIVEIISSYVHLKKAGRNFKGPCPFHHEKTPSLVVNPDKKIFRCFGCATGGNVISFVMKQEHLEFPEAIRMLAQKVNLTIPDSNSEGASSTNLRQQIFKVNGLAAAYFHDQLMAGKGKSADIARAYLKKRKISRETADQFQLGFAPDAWDGVISYLRDNGVSLKLMEQAGLIIARNKSDGFYDRFRNRIIFPILDTQGHCRAFGARALGENDGAKYINSPETPVYVKGHHLYGFHLAKQAIAREERVIIVEGYMDCLMPFQAGVTHVVASLGTALTVEQIRLVHRYTKNVTMLFDMDPAGESAMLRSLDTLIEEGMNIKVATLSQGHDPDSFIREFGGDAFRERIKDAHDVFDYKLAILRRRYDLDGVEGKARISSEMLQTIDKYDHAVLRSEYLKRLAFELVVPEEALGSELSKVRQMSGERKTFGRESLPKTPVVEQLRVVEADILKLLLEDGRFIAATKNEIDPEDFQDQKIREVISKMYDLVEGAGEIDGAKLINSFSDPKVQELIAQLLTKEGCAEGDRGKMHSDYVQRMKKDRRKIKMKVLQEKIGVAENARHRDELDALLKEYNRLVKDTTF